MEVLASCWQICRVDVVPAALLRISMHSTATVSRRARPSCLADQSIQRPGQLLVLQAFNGQFRRPRTCPSVQHRCMACKQHESQPHSSTAACLLFYALPVQELRMQLLVIWLSTVSHHKDNAPVERCLLGPYAMQGCLSTWAPRDMAALLRQTATWGSKSKRTASARSASRCAALSWFFSRSTSCVMICVTSLPVLSHSRRGRRASEGCTAAQQRGCTWPARTATDLPTTARGRGALACYCKRCACCRLCLASECLLCCALCMATSFSPSESSCRQARGFCKLICGCKLHGQLAQLCTK